MKAQWNSKQAEQKAKQKSSKLKWISYAGLWANLIEIFTSFFKVQN